MAQNIKTIQGVALASVKTIQGIAIASIKTIQGVDNTGGGGNPYGTEVASDDFNRANETPLAGNWTTGGGDSAFNLSSNTIVPSDLNNDCTAFRNTGTYTNDQYSALAVTVTDTDTGEGMGVCVRHAGAGTKTFYRAILNSAGVIEVGRQVTGTYTAITTRSVTYSAGTVIALSVSGTTLKVWYGGTQQGADITDANIATGSPGVSYSSTSTSPSGDTWSGGTVP